ncbi:unnamed protein product [Ectocarpus sp. CCAP 1310/34]|nr:unnamed protein product [Ectocarpus sp. CCAP 1310/34]
MASFSIKAALAAASALQSTNQAMSANLRDALAGESEDGWSDEEEEEEEDFGPCDRETRERPDYSSSAWGVRLANLESLRIAGRLVPSSREAKAFRSDFRVPYEFSRHFVDLVRTVFPTATRDVAGRQCVPLELKVLKKVAGEYGDMGCPGAVASVDCTHISWPACPFSETNTHKGKEGDTTLVYEASCHHSGRPFSETNTHKGKEGYTTLVYEASCDHSGRILSSTKGFPGAENDKTVVKRDLSVLRMREEEPWASYKFVLFDLEGNTTEHTGKWLIVDGGYHRVSSVWVSYMARVQTTREICTGA